MQLPRRMIANNNSLQIRIGWMAIIVFDENTVMLFTLRPKIIFSFSLNHKQTTPPQVLRMPSDSHLIAFRFRDTSAPMRWSNVIYCTRDAFVDYCFFFFFFFWSAEVVVADHDKAGSRVEEFAENQWPDSHLYYTSDLFWCWRSLTFSFHFQLTSPTTTMLTPITLEPSTQTTRTPTTTDSTIKCVHLKPALYFYT